jgi:uncharacterized protein
MRYRARVSDGRIRGKWALVTGSSSGIGAAMARVLAEYGANLVLVARRRDRLEALAAEIRDTYQVQVRVEPCDLAEAGAPEKLFARTEGGGLPIDILVNNAGVGHYGSFVNTPWSTYEGVLRLNVDVPTRLTHMFVRPMVERGFGHVINVASIGAYSPTPKFGVYTGSKAFLLNFSESLDFDLRGTGVRVACVSPGGTATEFMDHSNQRMKNAGVLMPADRCARIGIEKALAGRRTVVTGFLNALGMWLLRFVPRAWMPGIAGKAMDFAVSVGDERPAT